MAMILKQSDMTDADWEAVHGSLSQGGLAVLPSDTVYGLACLATLPQAVERIYQVKGRRHDKPVALVFTSVSRIEALIPELPKAVSAALERLLPGPVTAVVPYIDEGGIDVRGGGSVGVRIIPPPSGDIYEYLPGPLAVTSANLSGQPDTNRLDEVPAAVLDACEYVVDNGPCELRVPSTVVDLRPLAAGGAPVILREGSMPAEEIERRLGRDDMEAGQPSRPGGSDE